MRRRDRQLTNRQEILSVVDACKVCRLGLSDGGRPYVVPVSFGYSVLDDALEIYIHCAKEGRKLEILGRNPSVCVEMDCEFELIAGERACEYSCAYASVIGFGCAVRVKDSAEKCRALSCIMRHQTGGEFSFTPEQAASVEVLRVRLDEVSGKRRAK